MLVPTIHDTWPAVWCYAGATTLSAYGLVVLRDGRAVRPYDRVNQLMKQALIPLQPGDLFVILGGGIADDRPTRVQVRRYAGAWVEKRRADGAILAEVELETVSPALAEGWLASEEGGRFWAACRTHNNRVWPLGS